MMLNRGHTEVMDPLRRGVGFVLPTGRDADADPLATLGCLIHEPLESRRGPVVLAFSRFHLAPGGHGVVDICQVGVLPAAVVDEAHPGVAQVRVDPGGMDDLYPTARRSRGRLGKDCTGKKQ